MRPSAAGRQDRLLYYAFDLLYLDGFDLRGAWLAERKRMLAELLADTSERILYAEHLERHGPEIQERACAMGLEGIVSKQQDAPYRSGRVESWIRKERSHASLSKSASEFFSGRFIGRFGRSEPCK